MSKLYLIPTPIGNLEDLTYRAKKVLEDVDHILAEDTRHSHKLLVHYGINKPMTSFHQHNEHKQCVKEVEAIGSGRITAYISDAGTPGISDPGFMLVRACIAKEIPVECLPGPTAVIPALVQSGLPCERFVFEGFLPHKKGRQKRINALKEELRTIVLYESPHRLAKTLDGLAEALGGDRNACICRELTKIHEACHRGTLDELHAHYRGKKTKGEIVIIIGAAL